MDTNGVKVAKFQTLCGRTFESSSSLADFLGVTKGAISHAKSEAKGKGRGFFECGKPLKRFIRILECNTEQENKNIQETQPESLHEQPSAYYCRFLNASVLGHHMKTLHVQGHVQAAALKLFPQKNLRLTQILNDDFARNLTDQNYPTSIAVAVIKTNEASCTMFDLAEMWMLYSPRPAESIASYRQALFGDGDYGMAQDINIQNYPSLMFASCSIVSGSLFSGGISPQHKCHEQGTTLRPYMIADDVLRFLMSSFASTVLKRFHDNLFDRDEKKHANGGSNAQESPEHTLQEACKQEELIVNVAAEEQEHAGKAQAAPPSYNESMRYPCATAQDDFMNTCSVIMKDVDCSLQLRCDVLMEHGASKRQKLQMAAAAVHNVASMLFAANKLLYSEAST